MIPNLGPMLGIAGTPPATLWATTPFDLTPVAVVIVGALAGVVALLAASRRQGAEHDDGVPARSVPAACPRLAA